MALQLRPSFAALLCFISAPLVFAGNVQLPGLTLPPTAAGNRSQVVDIFERSWSAYMKYAYPHDDLSPVSDSYSDPLGGWGASIVDAMDTMLVMGLEDLFQQALNYTQYIDFNRSYTPQDSVSVFETTIRYVGGYMSAYELSGYKYPILVEKAKQVTDKLMYGFTGSSPIPYNYLNFTTNQPLPGTTNVAQAGTLTLEYNRLSHYTGNQTYVEYAQNAVKWMMNLTDPFPGLPAQVIDPGSGDFVDAYVTWGGGTDSYLEYLIKYPRLTNTNDNSYADTWALAVDSSIRELKRTSTVGNWTYMADWDGTQIVHVGSHLECFMGGNWILGGALLNNQTIVDYGLLLADSCWNTYASTATKIGPEVFYYISSDGNYTGDNPPTPQQLAFYNEHGFYIASPDYIQRPEVLETNFYAWRITGDTKYLDRAASAIESFETYLYTPSAYAGLNNVSVTTGGSNLVDDMESFWFAEVLKYLYLTFDDPNHISLNDYV